MTAAAKRRKVLVIEDEAMIAMLIEDMLTELGFTPVGPGADMERALSMVEQAEFDAVILDVNLGGERTMPIAATLRARGLPFLFATGYGTSGIDEEFKDQIVLTKPFRNVELEEALRTLLG
jgi:DNA-binding response OmpR family regulator